MTAEQLGENLDLSYRKYEPKEDDQRINKMTPEQFAAERLVPVRAQQAPCPGANKSLYFLQKQLSVQALSLRSGRQLSHKCVPQQ